MTVPIDWSGGSVAHIKFPLPPDDCTWPLSAMYVIDAACLMVDWEEACKLHIRAMMKAIDNVAGIMVIPETLTVKKNTNGVFFVYCQVERVVMPVLKAFSLLDVNGYDLKNKITYAPIRYRQEDN